jgi:hypothetical protein
VPGGTHSFVHAGMSQACSQSGQLCSGVALSESTPACLPLQGNTIVVGRKSPYSLYDDKISSFEDDGGAYDQKDAAGFIKLQARACVSAPRIPTPHPLRPPTPQPHHPPTHPPPLPAGAAPAHAVAQPRRGLEQGALLSGCSCQPPPAVHPRQCKCSTPRP